LIILAGSWIVAWFGPSSVSRYSFFPLWLGYILTVDDLVFIRASTSLRRRGLRPFLGLFFASIPIWWLYEAFNVRLQNWHYLYPADFDWLERRLLASLCFSTVVPAIFETMELVLSFKKMSTLRSWLRIAPGHLGLIGFSAAGVAMIALSMGFPKQAFPLVWLGLFFAIDPLLQLAGAPSLSAFVRTGNWTPVVALFIAGIVCGFFWEFWNYWSHPKWVYTIPYVGRPKIFEMPILGYGGYLPFALEIFSIAQLINWLVPLLPVGYLRLDPYNRSESAVAAQVRDGIAA
jgi:hypothetical protein